MDDRGAIGSEGGVVVVKGKLHSGSAHTRDTIQHQVSSEWTDNLRFLILLVVVVKGQLQSGSAKWKRGMKWVGDNGVEVGTGKLAGGSAG